MRRLLKVLCAVVIAACVLPVRLHAGSVYNLTLVGDKCYDQAYEVLELVNKERKANGLSALTMDATQLEAAMLRAVECHYDYNHTRPDGTECLTALPTPAGASARSENINVGGNASTPQGIVESWMNSDSHRKAILDSRYKSTGIGVFFYEGRSYWTEFFSSETAKVPARKYNTYTPVTFKVDSDNFTNISVKFNASPLPVGSSTQAYVQRINRGSGYALPLNRDDFTWTSSNTSVATVSSNGVVKGISKGTASITAYLRNSNLSFSTKITVDNGVAVNATTFPDTNFRDYVLSYFDEDGNKTLSEAELNAVTYVGYSYSTMTSIKGVEYFPNVETITVSNSAVTEFNISGFAKLREVTFGGNNVQSVTVTNCPALQTVNVSNTSALTDLNVVNCITVSKVNAKWSTKLVNVRLLNLPKLTVLDLAGTSVTSVDVSTSPYLKTAVQDGTCSKTSNYYSADREYYTYTYNSYSVAVKVGAVVTTAGGGKYKDGVAISSGVGTGLYNLDGAWKYYVNGTFTSATGLVQRPDTGKWYYVQNGIYTKATGLVRRVDNGKWFYVQNGVYTKATGLAKRVDNGKWYYVQNGAYVTATGLVRRIDNGKWFYVLKGAYTKFTGVVKRIDNGKYYYVKDGAYTKYTGLAKDAAGYTYAVTAGVAVRK